MTRRQRTMLFSGAAALFFVISPAIIFYAAGYRFDFAAHRFIKTGGLSITAGPQPVNVYVNGALVGSNNFIVRNVFIANLLPGRYKIDITKDGYYPWAKTLEVVEGSVAEALNVLLYPKNPQITALAARVDSLFASPDGSKILFVQDGNLGPQIFYKDSDKQDIVLVQTLVRGATLENVSWSGDANVFILQEKIGGTPHIFWGDASNLGNGPKELSSSVPGSVLAHMISPVQLSPDKNSLYVLASPLAQREGLYVLHLDSRTFAGPLQEKINGFLSTDDGIYVLRAANGVLSKCSFDLSSCSDLGLPSSLLANDMPVQIVTDGEHLAMVQNKNLYMYEPENQAISFITNDVNAVFFSPEKYKLAIQKDHEVSVYWLKDMVRGEQHKKGDTALLLRISAKISGVSWLADPYQYLAVEANDALRIVELDGRDKRNIISYPKFSSAQNIFWQKGSANLLLLHSGTILQDFVQNQAQ